MNITVIGGGGYVGSLLVPALIDENYKVSVIDLFIFGSPEKVFGHYIKNENLTCIQGDVRDLNLVESTIKNSNTIIHLACISNDPSFELNPNLGKSINYDCFLPLLKMCKKQNIQRFVYASSSSVYGIKDEASVTEDLICDPLTDYSKYKLMCEEILLNESNNNFCATVLRPATVCGFSLRTRLDVIVNILTNHAYNKKKITIFGGSQKRPNIHIKDMVRAYLAVLKEKTTNISDQIFNVGYQNYTLNQISQMVIKCTNLNIEVNHEPTDDLRSYHVSSKKISNRINFKPLYSVEDAISELCLAFKNGLLPNSFDDPRYFNIKTMQKIKLI